MPKKKKLLWNSDFSKTLTGFGRNSKAVLKYLYDTGKYDIVEFSCAPFTFRDKRLECVPWKAYGALPEDPFVWRSIEQGKDEGLKVSTRYGSYYLDEIIQKERPDCFIGVQDFWAFHEIYDKPWWNKINCALWITLDSLPVYSDAIQNAHKIKNFWVWSKFAENEMHRLGFDHVKTLHGAFDVSDFKPLVNRKELKKQHGLEDCFVFGFVFRNQVRKLVGTLLESFSIYKKKNPDSNAKVLLHTCWSEGWKIQDFIKEFEIDNNDIVTTHLCRNCRKFTIKPFVGEEVDCPHCRAPKAMITPSGGFGVSEGEMNIIYNLMDFYIHPVTSGGLEMPVVESLLAGVPVATANYSCGEEFCEQLFVTTIPHSEYREIGSQFKKAQPYAENIAEIMESIQLSPEILEEKSEQGRIWALDQFSIEKICKKIEEWIDSCPEVEHDEYSIQSVVYNEEYEFNEKIENPENWAIDLIKGVFGYNQSELDSTVKRIVQNLSKGEDRRSIHEKAIASARTHNESKKRNAASNFFKNDSETNNICFIAPSSLEQKIIVSKFFAKLCEENDNVFLVGMEMDKNLFSQFGKFVLLPKNSDTNQVEWLAHIKNKEGKRRFKKIYHVEGNSLKEIENES